MKIKLKSRYQTEKSFHHKRERERPFIIVLKKKKNVNLKGNRQIQSIPRLQREPESFNGPPHKLKIVRLFFVNE